MTASPVSTATPVPGPVPVRVVVMTSLILLPVVVDTTRWPVGSTVAVADAQVVTVGERVPIGGDPSQGYYNTTPPSGGEPPPSPSGHSLYTEEEFAAWDAAGRPSNHDYLNGGGYGDDNDVPDPEARGGFNPLSGWFSRG